MSEPLLLEQGGFVSQRMNAFIPEQDSWFEQLIKNNTCKSILVPEVEDVIILRQS